MTPPSSRPSPSRGIVLRGGGQLDTGCTHVPATRLLHRAANGGSLGHVAVLPRQAVLDARPRGLASGAEALNRTSRWRQSRLTSARPEQSVGRAEGGRAHSSSTGPQPRPVVPAQRSPVAAASACTPSTPGGRMHGEMHPTWSLHHRGSRSGTDLSSTRPRPPTAVRDQPPRGVQPIQQRPLIPQTSARSQSGG